MNERLEQLDSLRGLAALTVVFSHFLNMYPIIINGEYNQYSNWFVTLIKFTPLHAFWAGHEAVIFFFVLSGFVLSLPFLKKDGNITYKVYITKRICRIYIPYFFALCLSVLTNIFFYKGGNPNLSVLFNMIGQSPTDIKLVMQHILLIGSFPNHIFNPALWSLVQEMRISIIFPIIMFFIFRYNWKSTLCGGIILSIVMMYFKTNSNFSSDFFDTFHYIGIFIVGALLAKHRLALIQIIKGIKSWTKFIFLSVAICLYTFNWWHYYFSFLRNYIIESTMVLDWINTLAIAIFILLSLSTKFITEVLSIRIVHFLGKISYSVYLYHMICTVTLINLLYGAIPLWSILVISLITTLVISMLSYKFIEVPSMNLGKFFAEKLNKFKLSKVNVKKVEEVNYL